MMNTRGMLVVGALLLAGCGSDAATEPEGVTDAAVATTEVPQPVPVASEPTQEDATSAEPEAPAVDEEDDTHLVMGAVNAPTNASLGPMDGEQKCMGYGDYGDVEEGMQVRVYGASNNIVDVTELGAAVWSEEFEECIWWFTSSVPAGEGFYYAEIEGFGSSDVMTEEEAAEFAGLLIVPD